MSLMLAWCCCQWAFVWLAQSLPRHARHIGLTALNSCAERRRRRAGFALLLLALALLWSLYGPAHALLYFAGLTSLAALLTALILSRKASWLRWPAP